VCSPHQHVQTATFAFERFGRAQLQNDKAILVGFLAEMARAQIVRDPFLFVPFRFFPVHERQRLTSRLSAQRYISLLHLSTPVLQFLTLTAVSVSQRFVEKIKLKKKGKKLATIKN
jgi:hypothetical protein